MGARSSPRAACRSRSRERLDTLLFKPDKMSLEWRALDQAATAAGLAIPRLLAAAGALAGPEDYFLRRFAFEFFPRGTGFAEVPPLPEPEAPARGDGARLLHRRRTRPPRSTTPSRVRARCRRRRARGRAHRRAGALLRPRPSARGDGARAPLHRRTSRAARSPCCPEAAVDARDARRGPARGRRLALPHARRRDARGAVATESRLERDRDRRQPAPRRARPAPERGGRRRGPRRGRARRRPASRSGGSREAAARPRAARARRRPTASTTPSASPAGAWRSSRAGAARPVDMLVSELMIHVNATWGKLLADRGYDAIYRNQRGVKTRMEVEPGAHEWLGVSHYAWSSSPLRRFTDLANQRQLVAALRREPPAYTPRGARRRGARVRGRLRGLRRAPAHARALLVPALPAAGGHREADATIDPRRAGAHRRRAAGLPRHRAAGGGAGRARARRVRRDRPVGAHVLCRYAGK